MTEAVNIRKWRALLLAVGLAVLVAVGIWVFFQSSAAPSLVGTWSNSAEQNRISYTFHPDGTGVLSIGPNRLEYRYTVDFERQPAWLDLSTTSPNGAPVTIRAIAERTSYNKLKIRMPFTRSPGTRPTGFVDNDLENTILLRRASAS